MTLKLVCTAIMMILLIFVFKEGINSFADFDFYVNNPFGPGPNLGFRWIIYILGISDVITHSTVYRSGRNAELARATE